MKLLFVPLLCVVATFVWAAPAEPIVFVVRHAEKATEGGGSDPDLSPEGQTRADALARILKDAGITTIITSEFKRTQETALPTATELAIAPKIIEAKDTAALVARLQQLTGNALVVGHGDSIPKLIKALGIDTPVEIKDDDYTELFIITLTKKPQLVRLHFPS